MNNHLLVKISNIIGIISIVLLVYWVFIFISIEVFGFKVFRENLTQSFYISVMGILALMFGALIINIMFNLTRIASKHNIDDHKEIKNGKLKIWGLILSFPVIFGLLYFGDYLTSRKKENLLVSSAKSIIEKNITYTDKLLDYKFSEQYILTTSEILEVLTETDKNFPTVTVITKDSIDNNKVYLSFSEYYPGDLKDTIEAPPKKKYIQKTTQEERDYFETVFDKKNDKYMYSASDGDYELYYPVRKGKKVIILYFSDQQRYGKIGS